MTQPGPKRFWAGSRARAAVCAKQLLQDRAALSWHFGGPSWTEGHGRVGPFPRPGWLVQFLVRSAGGGVDGSGRSSSRRLPAAVARSGGQGRRRLAPGPDPRAATRSRRLAASMASTGRTHPLPAASTAALLFVVKGDLLGQPAPLSPSLGTFCYPFGVALCFAGCLDGLQLLSFGFAECWNLSRNNL